MLQKTAAHLPPQCRNKRCQRKLCFVLGQKTSSTGLAEQIVSAPEMERQNCRSSEKICGNTSGGILKLQQESEVGGNVLWEEEAMENFA